MDEAETHSQIKNNLQQRLLSAVKQCQKYYGANDDVGTEGDMRVSSLCSEWEAVVVHGIRKQKRRGFNKLESSNGGVSMWSTVSPLLSNEEAKRFLKLEHANTDIGRGRAWLRAALNERTLEDYLHSLLSNRPHLLNYYESHAFLLDEERAAMLPTMAAGLGTIIFSLSIDSDYLNSPMKTVEARSVPLPLTHTTPTPAVQAPPPSFEALPPTQLNFGSRISNKILNEDDNDCVVGKKEKKKRIKKVKTASPQPTNRQSTNQIPVPSTNQIPVPSTNQIPVPSTNQIPVPSTTPTHDIETTNSSDTPTHTTSDSNSNHDNLNPFNDNQSLSSSVNSMNSFGENTVLFNAPSDPCINKDTIMMDSQSAIEATTMVLAATGEHQRRALITPEDETSVPMSMTSEEMREALKVLVRNKEEIEVLKNDLDKELTEVKLLNESLKLEVNKLKEDLNNTRESNTHQSQGLERENDLLREQLKRYVGLVQQQQMDVQKDFTSTKLSEMAEMYGELMEFNDRLHKDVYAKNSVITRLCHTLLLAGLEIPVSSDQLPQEALQPKKIVDIWVPSVIRREKGHHVYQIYVSLGNEEWNVYRRFAEFYEFHQQMLKNIEGIEEFSFPPKKTIGSKAVQVVEERRSRLQEYLRFVVDMCSKPSVKRKDGRITRSLLDYDTTKENFIRIFPFFKPDINPIVLSSSSSSRPPLTKSPSYNGL